MPENVTRSPESTLIYMPKTGFSTSL